MTLTKIKVLQDGTGTSFKTVDDKLKNSVHVEDFGAVGNGTTNDATAFQNAINHVAGLGGGTVHFSKKHLIDSGITVKDYVSLKGPLDIGPDELRGSTADNVTVDGESNIVNYDKMAGQLIINSSATITFRDGAGLCGALLMRKGLDLPFTNTTTAIAGIAAFAGTAITVGGAGTTFKYLLILGFNQAIFSNGFERITCDNVRGDCTNGIDIRNCLDISYLSNCHFWPYTTTHQDGNDGTNNLGGLDGRQFARGGVAYRFESIGDWSKITNCFSYAYYIGFRVVGCNDVQLIGCGADWFVPTTAANTGTFDYTNTAQATYPTQANITNTTAGFTSVGFFISGTSSRTKLIACQAAAHRVAYVVNVSATNNSLTRTTFTDCSSWDIIDKHVFVKNGYTSFINCSYTDNNSNSETGIHIDSTADKSSILGCHFGNINDPINPGGTVTALHNTFDSCGSTDYLDPDAGSYGAITPTFGNLTGGDASFVTTTLRRQNSSAEGGEVQFQRANDASTQWTNDCFGSDNSARLRWHHAGAEKVLFQTSGNLDIVNGDLKVANGHGIDFSATGDGPTMSSELLDDYEEGTWTVTDGSGAGLTFGVTNNRYTKVGRLVTCSVRLAFPSTSDSSVARVSIPFLPDSGVNSSAVGGVCLEQNHSSSVAVMACINDTTGTCIFRPNGFGNLSNADLSGDIIRFTLIYHAA